MHDRNIAQASASRLLLSYMEQSSFPSLRIFVVAFSSLSSCGFNGTYYCYAPQMIRVSMPRGICPNWEYGGPGPPLLLQRTGSRYPC